MRLDRTFCLLLMVLAHQSWAVRLGDSHTYYPQDFYLEVENGLEDDSLKTNLHLILNSAHKTGNGHDTLVSACGGQDECYRHTSLGYNGARKVLFGELHLVKHGNSYAIFDLYCEKLMTDADFGSRPPRPGQIPDSNILNAEHTWPQSRFTGRFDKSMQKSDLHGLFPVLSRANSARGNVEFGDIVSPIASPCSASKRGYTARGGSKMFFEAPAAHKGNVARALFYFSTRYKMTISELEEDSLKAWHAQDPVDEAERARNEAIFDKQKVRNPYIDHPELVELIENF